MDRFHESLMDRWDRSHGPLSWIALMDRSQGDQKMMRFWRGETPEVSLGPGAS